MAAKKEKLRTERIPNHKLLKEIYKNLDQFHEFVKATGKHVIDHGYFVYNEDGSIKERVTTTISFWDLFYGLDKLSPRKREAVQYYVIDCMKQREAAEIMGISTVSVGQYVDQAMRQLSERYFAEENSESPKSTQAGSVPPQRLGRGRSDNLSAGQKDRSVQSPKKRGSKKQRDQTSAQIL